jgi:nitrogen fixation protein NifX
VRDTGLQAVAFATTDCRRVDQHFGSAAAYAIYAVGTERARLLRYVQLTEPEDGDHHAQIEERIAILEGCAGVYCEAIGPGVVRRLLARGVRPIAVDASVPIAGLLLSLQEKLRAGETPWGGRPLESPREQGPARFDAMAASPWVE